MTIAHQIAARRKAMGLSQARLAEIAQVSQQLVSQLERGENLTTKHLPRIARALNLSLAAMDPAYADPPASATGFAEDDAAVWRGESGPQPPGNAPSRETIFATLTPGVETRQVYTISKSLPAFGLLPGDVAIAEAKGQAAQGDLVIANLHDPQLASGRMLVRRYFPPYLISAALDEADQVITTETANIVARIVAILRLPEPLPG